jgi:sec-independent protein translocase protein TatC
MPPELPPKDVDAPLEVHLAELRGRLLVVVLVIVLLSIGAFAITDRLILVLKRDLLLEGVKLVALNPLDYLMARAKLAIVAALVLGTPIIIYEVFKFISPGLFPTEERFFLTVVPISLILFLLGAVFSYAVLTPRSIQYLITYSGEVAKPMLILGKFIGFISFMLLSFGLIFQIPLLLYLSVKGGVVSLEDLRGKRRYVYAALIGGSVLISPDPTPITPLIVAFALAVVYEISLFVMGRVL